MGHCGALPLRSAPSRRPQQGKLGQAVDGDQGQQRPSHPKLPPQALCLGGKAAPEMRWDGVGVRVVPDSAGPRAGQGCGMLGPGPKCSFEEEGEPR